jgi:hypothetical protein
MVTVEAERMRSVYPKLVWDAARMHLEIMQAADECFAEAVTALRGKDGFEQKSARVVAESL